MLKTDTTAEAYSKFQALVDYLDLPEPVHNCCKLLPPPEVVTNGHFPVLNLHHYAMAGQAVDLMLNSTAYMFACAFLLSNVVHCTSLLWTSNPSAACGIAQKLQNRTVRPSYTTKGCLQW